jgi:predicted transcriptional regulator YdeE
MGTKSHSPKSGAGNNGHGFSSSIRNEADMSSRISEGFSKPALVFGFKTELSFSDFGTIADIFSRHYPAMLAELEMNALSQIAPETYIYDFLDDPMDPASKESGRLRLTICIPISERFRAIPPYEVIEIPEFKYVSIPTHTFADWETVRQEAESRKLKRTKVEREVYKRWVGMGSAENELELQVGIE